jgi:hypothetical protein
VAENRCLNGAVADYFPGYFTGVPFPAATAHAAFANATGLGRSAALSLT